METKVVLTSLILIILTAGGVLTQSSSPTPQSKAPSSTGSPSSKTHTTASSHSATTTGVVTGGGGSVFGGPSSDTRTGTNTQTSSRSSYKFDSDVPYDLKDPANPHWRHFLEEVALQTSRDLADLQNNGKNDPIISAMWDVYVQTLSDGTGLPSGGAAPMGNNAFGGSAGPGADMYGGGGGGLGTGGDGHSSTGSGGTGSSATDKKVVTALYGMGWFVTTPPPPTPPSRWFLSFFKQPASSAAAPSSVSSSSASSNNVPQQTSSSSSGQSTATSRQSALNYNSLQQQYLSALASLQKLVSQVGTNQLLQQQRFGSASNSNMLNSARTSLTSPTSFMAFSRSRQTPSHTSTQTAAPVRQIPEQLLQTLRRPASGLQQQRPVPRYGTPNMQAVSSGTFRQTQPAAWRAMAQQAASRTQPGSRYGMPNTHAANRGTSRQAQSPVRQTMIPQAASGTQPDPRYRTSNTHHSRNYGIARQTQPPARRPMSPQEARVDKKVVADLSHQLAELFGQASTQTSAQTSSRTESSSPTPSQPSTRPQNAQQTSSKNVQAPSSPTLSLAALNSGRFMVGRQSSTTHVPRNSAQSTNSNRMSVPGNSAQSAFTNRMAAHRNIGQSGYENRMPVPTNSQSAFANRMSVPENSAQTAYTNHANRMDVQRNSAQAAFSNQMSLPGYRNFASSVATPSFQQGQSWSNPYQYSASNVRGGSASVRIIPQQTPHFRNIRSMQRGQNVIESPSNSPGRPPAVVNTSTNRGSAAFNIRPSGCRRIDGVLEMEATQAMDMTCAQLCPAMIPGMTSGRQTGTACLCCPTFG